MILSQRNQMIQKTARAFAAREITPIAAELDECAEFPMTLWRKIADAGYLGVRIPKDQGGQGADCMALVTVIEELSYGAGGVGSLISGPNSLNTSSLIEVGTPEQKKKYLYPALRGDLILCFALTEAGAGSDAGSVAARAVKTENGFVLNGAKSFISFAPVADAALVFAKTDPAAGTKGISAFLVDLDLPGVIRGPSEHKMGIRCCPVGEITMNNVHVPGNALLGKLNEGYQLAMKSLDIGRLGVSAQALGIAQSAADQALNYAKQRKQFGHPISKFQAISFYLAEMATRLSAMRLMVYDTAQRIDQGEEVGVAAAMTKLYCADTAVEIVDRALQIMGGNGYMTGNPVERCYRDIRILPIYEGTSEIQKLVISKAVLKKETAR